MEEGGSMKGRFWKGALVLLATFALGATAALAKEVDWTALNPAFQGATYVKDTNVCWGCHEDAKAAFNHTAHAKVFQFVR
jgi:hypothetical protein